MKNLAANLSQLLSLSSPDTSSHALYRLRLCETQEYSPRILEHWLHTIQKKKQATIVRFQEKNGKVEIVMSEDLSTYLRGSRVLLLETSQPVEAKSLEVQASRTSTHWFIQKPSTYGVIQTKGPLLPIKRYTQLEDKTQKTHIAPWDSFLKTLAQTPGAFLEFHFKPIRDRKREWVLKKVKKTYFQVERHFDQWESKGWFHFKLRRWWGPLIRKILTGFVSSRDAKHVSPARRPDLQEQIESSHEREDPKRAVLDKLSRPLFEVHMNLSHPFSAFIDGFGLPYLGSLSIQSGKGSPLVFSAEELASLLSLPNAKEQAPYLETEVTAYLPCPLAHPLEFSEEDRKRHLYILGKTGMGKSTVLLHLFDQDVQKNHALIILDPHGDLISEALNRVPSEHCHRLVLLDPAETKYPLAINPLECSPEENPSLKSSALVEMFEVLAEGSWGPRLEYILRNALLLLIVNANTTLLDLPLLLNKPLYVRQLLSRQHDPELRRFFEDEFLSLNPKTRQEYTAPILNKVGPLLTTPLLRNMFSQPKAKFSFEQAFEKRKIVLIPLSKGKLGEDASRLLGMIFLSMIQSTLLRRAHLEPEQRCTVAISIDEFQNFATPTLLSMLSESRKYGLALTFANQYLTQVSPEIQDATLGNVGSLLCFRSSYADAQILAPSLGLMENDLTGLAPFQAYAKFLHHQNPLPVFRLELKKLAPMETDSSTKMLELTKLLKTQAERYGRRLALVEEKVENRYNKRRLDLHAHGDSSYKKNTTSIHGGILDSKRRRTPGFDLRSGD